MRQNGNTNEAGCGNAACICTAWFDQHMNIRLYSMRMWDFHTKSTNNLFFDSYPGPLNTLLVKSAGLLLHLNESLIPGYSPLP